jgi:uncharacterized protein (DUF1330 family)
VEPEPRKAIPFDAALTPVSLGNVSRRWSMSTNAPNPAYFLALLRVTDIERYRREYGLKVLPQLAAAGAKVLVASTSPTVLEGAWDATWTVVIEFPDRARRCAGTGPRNTGPSGSSASRSSLRGDRPPCSTATGRPPSFRDGVHDETSEGSRTGDTPNCPRGWSRCFHIFRPPSSPVSRPRPE